MKLCAPKNIIVVHKFYRKVMTGMLNKVVTNCL